MQDKILFPRSFGGVWSGTPGNEDDQADKDQTNPGESVGSELFSQYDDPQGRCGHRLRKGQGNGA